MKVVNSLGDLFQDRTRFPLAEELLSEDFIQQFSPGKKLRDHVHVSRRNVHLKVKKQNVQ